MENNNFVNDIKAIIDENKVQVIPIGDRTFTTMQLNEIKPKKDRAAKIEFSDLGSVVEIVKQEMNRFNTPLYINIENERRVSVLSSMDMEKEREIPYAAIAEGSKFNFGGGYDYERFVIAVRSLFCQSADTASLLELLKKVSSVDTVDVEDDGITQQVTAKQGVSLSKTIQVAPIRKLAPYRTFLEIEQPVSEFLFRITGGTFALHEADGGAWKIAAKKSIKAYFETALAEEIKASVVIVLG